MIDAQERIKPVIESLSIIPGVESVRSDDWDSAGINVFVTLRGTQHRLDQRLQDTKRRIRQALSGTDFVFLDWPAKRYSYNGRDCMGKAIMFDEGYDHRHIKLEVLF